MRPARAKACLPKVGTGFGKKDTLEQRAKAMARIRMIATRFRSLPAKPSSPGADPWKFNHCRGPLRPKYDWERPMMDGEFKMIVDQRFSIQIRV